MKGPAAKQAAVLLCLGLCLGLIPQRSAAKRVIRSVRHLGTTYLLLADVARYYGMDLEVRGARMELRSRYSRLWFQRDQREMRLNGVAVHQSYAPSFWGGDPVVSEVDFNGILEPVLRRESLPRQAVRRVVLDPGHGGRDSGALGEHSEEKDLVWALALRTARRLRRHGFQVLLTRSGDEFVSLSQRSEAARRGRADLFVSLHTNAVDSRGVDGIETYVLTPPGTPSTYGRERSAEADSSGDGFIRQSTCLGYEIHRQLVARSAAEDRGLRHANFSVLRKTPAPAVLIEAGFITNPADERRLRMPAQQEEMAAAIVEGIRRYSRSVARHPGP